MSSAKELLLVDYAQGVFGTEVWIQRLATALSDHGIHPTLLGPSGDARSQWLDLGFDHLLLPVAPSAGIRNIDGSRPGLKSLAGEISRTRSAAKELAPVFNDFDLIHSHSMIGHLEVAMGSAIAGTPCVIHIHDLVRGRLGTSLLGAALLRADTGLAISRSVAARVPRWARRKVDVVPNGVDLGRFDPDIAPAPLRSELGLKGGDLLVGVVGRLHPRKRVDLAARGVLATGNHVHLAVIGSDDLSEFGALHGAELRAEFGDATRIHFLGKRNDVEACMTALDVVLNTADAEPFGLTLLEAMAAGRSAITTDAGGAGEIVTNGVDGLKVPPDDLGALVTALERLDDSVERERLGAAARSTAEKFSQQRHVEHIVRSYRRLL